MPSTPDDGSGPLDVDAAFAEIVARWGEDARAQGTGAPAGTGPDDAGGDGGAGDAADHGPDEHPESRTARPATPLPPPPREDVPVVAEEVAEEDTREPLRFEPPAPARARDDEPDELAALGDGERFVPEDPQPLPRDLVAWAAWAAVVGAPLFLLVVALAWRDVPRLVTAVTAAVFVAGFATLVVRLPSSRDDDDDGAVV